MRATAHGARRLLDAVTDERHSEMACAECQQYLPKLADDVIAGASTADVAPGVVAHLDSCLECEALFVELLGDLCQALSVSMPQVASRLDLPSLPQPDLRTDRIWRAPLEAVMAPVRSTAGRLQAMRLSLRMLASWSGIGAQVREYPSTYRSVPLSAPAVLEGASDREKLLFVRTLAAEGELQVDLRASREPGAATCRLQAEVDSPQPGAPRPRKLTARHAAQTWEAIFDPWGQASVDSLPVVALSELEIILTFQE